MASLLSCTKSDDVPTVQDSAIKIEVADMQSQQTRAHLLNTEDDVKAEGEFGLNAYLTNGGNTYFENAWVYYFIPDYGEPQWRFRDVVNQDNLVNFYWPNDSNVNFVAYMPRILNKCAATIENISYTSAEGMQFNATMPTEITDITPADRVAENNKLEFVYACSLNQGKDVGDDGTVKLRFVHPFAMIKFRLAQSHRDLTIHSITLHNLGYKGSFASTDDTYATLTKDNLEELTQDYLTDRNWTISTKDNYTIQLDKKVPEDINYTSQIGGPYMVIPQNLSGVTLSINYTWDTANNVTTTEVPISTNDVVPAWLPGKIYTYHLNLGDNKEEVLFMVTVEDWKKGEDDGYENNYEVK